MLLFHQAEIFFLCGRAGAVHFCTVSRAVRLLRQQNKHHCAGWGQGRAYAYTGHKRALHPPSQLQISHSVITILKEGCFFSTLIPLTWFFLTPRWGQKLCSNKEWWCCALKSSHTKFIYISLGWRLGCVFFVQTLFLNSEAKHSLAFVGFFLFPRTAFCMYWQENSIALKDLKVSSASAALKVQLH